MPLQVKLVYLGDFRVLFGHEDPSVTTPVALMYLRDFAMQHGNINKHVEISLQTFDSKASVKDMVRAIDPAGADIIGVSCYFWNLDSSLRLMKKLKQDNPDVFLVMGGPESEETEAIMKKHPFIDVCVRGEGEELFVALVESRIRGVALPELPGLTIRNEDGVRDFGGRGILQDLNKLPIIYSDAFLEAFPPGEIFYHAERGCFCNCKYCTLGPPLRFRDLTLVESELERIFASPAITYVNIWDSDLTWDLDRFKSILRMVERFNTGGKKVSVNYGFLKMDDEVLELLGRNINRIIMGFQSTNKETSRMAGRTMYDLEARRSALEKAFHYIQPSVISAQFIVGLPGDNYMTLGESMRWTQRIGFTNVWIVQNLALPGTIYRRDAEKYGIEFKRKPFYNVYKTNTFSRTDMKRAKSTLFWFSALTRMFNSKTLRRLAAENVFTWDIADAMPELDKSTIEGNLEGGDMYDFTLKVSQRAHINTLCLTMLMNLSKTHENARLALEALS